MENSRLFVIEPKRIPRLGNKFWPLPADYGDLGIEARRAARLNACCMQYDRDSFVAAWNFFRQYYLKSQGRSWYVHGFHPSPKEHYLMVGDIACYNLNALGAPRSFAKSTVIGEEVPLWLSLTRRNFEILLYLAAQKFLSKRFDRFMAQLEDNERIIDDFGRMKPPGRGAGLWSHSGLRFATGAAIMGGTIEGRMLGQRPHMLIFDDVEFDPALKIAPTSRTEKFEDMMVNVALPMMEDGTVLCVVGTLHRRDFYIYHICRSGDPKYNAWNRRIIEIEDDTGDTIWKEKFSKQFLEQKRQTMGEAAYAANYLNRPASSKDRILNIHDDLGYYLIDGSITDSPLDSEAMLVSCRKKKGHSAERPNYEQIARPYGEVVQKMFRVLLVDYARTVSHHSDYSCVLCCGFENSDAYSDMLWVLDMFYGKVTSDDLIRTIWGMALKWRAQVIGIESVPVQKELADRVAVDVANWASGETVLVPRVMPVKYPSGLHKEDRIASMQWRFNQDRVLFPKQMRGTWPWNQLFRQIDDFTMDLALLAKDDAVDTLAMNQYVVRPRTRAADNTEIPNKPYHSLEALTEHNEIVDQFGMPAIGGLTTAEITPDIVAKLREAQYGDTLVEGPESPVEDHLKSVIWFDA